MTKKSSLCFEIIHHKLPFRYFAIKLYYTWGIVFMEETMDKLIDIITEYAGTNERMDSIILQDEEYNSLLAEIDEICTKAKIDNLLDNILSAYNKAHAYYQKRCYQQGLIDCVTLLKELGVL